MYNHGFVRAAAAVPMVKVGNCEYNVSNILDLIREASEKEAQFIVFPELSITSYTCGDLFHQEILIHQSLKQLEGILFNTANENIISIVGMPISVSNYLFNCGVVIHKGKILGVIPKTYIRSSEGYSEERWFTPGTFHCGDFINILGTKVPFGTDLLFCCTEDQHLSFGVEISEDLWALIPPSSYYSLSGATIIFNLSAAMEKVGLYEYEKDLIRIQSAKCNAAYIYTSAGIDESTTDGVFGGHGIIAENGDILTETKRFYRGNQLIFTDVDFRKLAKEKIKRNGLSKPINNPGYGEDNTTNWIYTGKHRKITFSLKDILPKNFRMGTLDKKELLRPIEPHPFVPSDRRLLDKRCDEIFKIQIAGIRKRILHTKSKHAVIGVSGGLDSTLALLVLVKCFDKTGKPRQDIIGVTMPGFGTTDATYDNAMKLMKESGISIMDIDIKPACLQHFKDIQHDVDVHDVTYENVQARERYQILMDLANKRGGLVIGTGDLSELALGWCTYAGDHMSMYNVNLGVPKTLIRHIITWFSNNMAGEKLRDVLLKITKLPISPELLPPTSEGEIKQKTEDIIGPYELHDFFMYYMIRFGMHPKKILFLAEHAFEGRYTGKIIEKWLKVFLKRFFSQQFKRSCMPDGPRIGSVGLSPRNMWDMPSDAESDLWLKF